MELKFAVQTKIQKPLAEVFDGVYNPSKLSKYFTTGGASGPLAEGTTVIWRFADYPGDIPVQVKKVVPNQLIVFEWGAGEGVEEADGTKSVETHGDVVCRVEMTFEALEGGSTLVRISESGWPSNEKGLQLSYGNCQGWTQMSCCLKAYLEYGINLREGAN